jgi:hypothetical protein
MTLPTVWPISPALSGVLVRRRELGGHLSLGQLKVMAAIEPCRSAASFHAERRRQRRDQED